MIRKKKLMYTSVGSVVKAVKEGINTVGTITGEGEKSVAKFEFLSYGYDEIEASEAAFKNATEQLKAVSKKDSNYKELVTNFKNCFSIYKTTIRRIFEKMAASADGIKKDYYYCSTQVAKMTIKDYSKVNIISFDEFKKSF